MALSALATLEAFAAAARSSMAVTFAAGPRPMSSTLRAGVFP